MSHNTGLESVYDERLRAIARLVAEGAPKEEFLAEARRLKEDMSKAFTRVWVQLTYLDYQVATFAPGAEWQTGWLTEPVFGTAGKVAGRPPRYDRAERTLEIAKGLVGEDGTVETVAIAEQLRTAGETASMKDLRTSIGNVLTSSGSWRRVGAGKYEVTAN